DQIAEEAADRRPDERDRNEAAGDGAERAADLRADAPVAEDRVGEEVAGEAAENPGGRREAQPRVEECRLRCRAEAEPLRDRHAGGTGGERSAEEAAAAEQAAEACQVAEAAEAETAAPTAHAPDAADPRAGRTAAAQDTRHDRLDDRPQHHLRGEPRQRSARPRHHVVPHVPPGSPGIL